MVAERDQGRLNILHAVVLIEPLIETERPLPIFGCVTSLDTAFLAPKEIGY